MKTTQTRHGCSCLNCSHHLSKIIWNHQIDWAGQSITSCPTFFTFPIFISQFVFLLINPIVECSWVSWSESLRVLWMKFQSHFNARAAFSGKSTQQDTWPWLQGNTSPTNVLVYSSYNWFSVHLPPSLWFRYLNLKLVDTLVWLEEDDSS